MSTFESLATTSDNTRPFSLDNNDMDLNFSAEAMTEFTSSQLLDDPTGVTGHGFCGPFGFQFTLNTVIVGLLCVLGLCGNTISILVLQKDRHNRVAVFLLQSLALADNSILCICFITLSMTYGLQHVADNNELFVYFRHIALKYTNPLAYIALSIGIWLTVLLAINRYIAVCRPFKAKRWLTMTLARVQVAIVVTFSVLFNIPRVFRYGDCSSSPNDTTNSSSSFCQPELTDLARQKWFAIFYLNVFYTPFVNVLPLVLLVGFNVPLIRQMQKTKRRMKRNSLSYSGRQENNITIVMIVVILELVILHTPDRIVQFDRSIVHTQGGQTPDCPAFSYIANNLANLLIIVNSSTNFIVYYICRRRFRRTLCQKLCCGWASSPTTPGADQSPLPSEAGSLAHGGCLIKNHSTGHDHQRRRHKSAGDDDGRTISLRDRYRLTKKRDSNLICLIKVNGTFAQ